MLDFILAISEKKIKPDGKAKLTFTFRNNSDKLIHILSYRFTTYRDNMVVTGFTPHDFFFDIPKGEEVQRQFGDVNISEAYLAGNTNPGVYNISVSIKYFICGEHKAINTMSNTEVEIE